MSFKKHVPNIVTLLNLTSGLIALVYAFDTNWQMAFLWVCIGIFFDFWDGFLHASLKCKASLVYSLTPWPIWLPAALCRA